MAENTWSPTKDPTIKGHYSYFVGWIRFYPIKYPDYIPGLFLIEHQKQYRDTIKPPLKSLNITKTHDIPMNLPFISHSYTYSGKIKDAGIESHEIRCFSWLPSPCFTMKPGIARQGVKAPGNSTDLHGLPKECGRWHLHAMGDLQDPKMGATLVAFFRILGHLLG